MAVKSIVKLSELEGQRRIDPEYYHPKYYSAIEHVLAFGQFSQLREIARITRGRNPSKYTDAGVPVVRAINLRDITSWEDMLSASPSERLFYLKQSDILISSIGAGSIGKVELFLDTKKATTVSEVSVIRVSGHSPAAVAAFLRTKYGYLQLERRITGSTGQLHLYPRDIGTVLVPLLNSKIQSELEVTLSESQKALVESKQLYLQAEQMLLDELSWGELDFSQPKSYAISLSQAKNSSRIDAEHFQPKYERLENYMLRTGKGTTLGNITTYIKRGVQPVYDEHGDVVVVNSKYVGKQFINLEDAERTNLEFWQANKRAQAQKYDVVINSTGWGTIGRSNCLLHDEKTVVDNHVTIIRAKEECNPAYLALFLNSIAGQMQTAKWLSGSSGQIEIYPSDISRFVVYLPSKEFQEKIADLVLQSYRARKKAKALLEEAKKQVEELIEKKGC
jgi:type I restriction enzyme M protein